MIKNDKRKKVLEELEEIAKICTYHTSINGIRQEFFGYVFLLEWKHRSISPFEKQTRNFIRQYWYDEKFNQPFLKRYL